jgi:POT family proton-dependent oligopeptide transporter
MDRIKAIGVFSFFTIFFWFAFEQAGGSMTIFAADYTDRTLVGRWHDLQNRQQPDDADPDRHSERPVAEAFFNTAKRYLMSNILL